MSDRRPRTVDVPPSTTETTGTTGSDTGPSTAPPRTRRDNQLESQIRDFYSQFGTYLGVMAPQTPAGFLIAKNAEPVAAAWTDLAAQDPNVRRTLEKLLTGGVWANVIGLHVANIVLPILAFGGRLPGNMSQQVIAFTLLNNPELAQVMNPQNGNGARPE